MLDLGYTLQEHKRKSRRVAVSSAGSGKSTGRTSWGAVDGAMDDTLHLSAPRLQCLSLWGCTRLRAVGLSCPAMKELCLRGCSNLEAGKLTVESHALFEEGLQAQGAGVSAADVLDGLRGESPGAAQATPVRRGKRAR